MWRFTSGVVLGLYGPGWPMVILIVVLPWVQGTTRRTLWLFVLGTVCGSGVASLYADRILPETVWSRDWQLKFSGCEHWASAAHRLRGYGCRLVQAPWPAWENVRLNLSCSRCPADRVPKGGFEVTARLQPQSWWVNDGSYQIPPQWRSPGQQVRVRIKTLIASATTPIDQRAPPKAGLTHAGSIRALVHGDTSGLTADQWRILSDSGLMHLLIVSGLHVGALLAVWAVLLGWLRRQLGGAPAVWHSILVIGAGILVWRYALHTGSGVPVLRAGLMGVGGLLITVLHLWRQPLQLLGLAVAAMLLWQPGSVFLPGFWLSFGLVLAIVMSLNGRIRQHERRWVSVVSLQTRLTCFSSALLAILFHQIPVLSLPANLLMIPWMVGVVFPLAVGGTLVESLHSDSGQWLLAWADQGFSVFWSVAKWAAGAGTFWLPAHVSLWPALLLFAGICLLSLRVMSLAGISALALAIVYGLDTQPLNVHIIDVGQGSAALIRQGRQGWLIDTGTAYAAQRVVVPLLRYHGIRRLTLITSHADRDHSGGVASVSIRWPDMNRIASQTPGDGWQRCHAGQVIRSGPDWTLEAIWPDERLSAAASDNNHSCVLRLRVGDWQVLFPGDLERRWQYALVHALQADRRTVWILPHHGARNGLNPRVWATLAPDLAIVSVDRYSPYHHPSRDVVQWLGAHKVPWLSTADQGEIILTWPRPDTAPLVSVAGKRWPAAWRP